jgi:hypothetical protein
MKENDFTVTNNLALLGESKRAFANGDYILAASLANSIIDVKSLAFSVHSMLLDLKNNIDQASSRGLDVSLTEHQYDLALASFNREDYVRAEQIVKDATLTYAVEIQGKVNVVKFITNNWLYILILIVLSWYFGGFGYRKIELYLIDKRLVSLNNEESIIEKLRSEAEKDYFLTKKLSKDVYFKHMHEHEKRLGEIVKSRQFLASRVSLLTDVQLRIKQLEGERKVFEGKIKTLQKSYFKDKSIPRSKYDIQLKNYRRRRIGIRQEMDVLKSKLKEPKRYKNIFKNVSGFSKRFFIILVLFAVISNITFAQISSEQASIALVTAEESLRLMIGAGFNIMSLTSMLNTSESFFNEGSYDEAYELANQISVIKQRAFSVSDRFYEIDSLIFDLESNNVNIEQQILDYDKSKDAFYREDYSTADTLSTGVLNDLEDLQSQFLLNRTLTIAETSNIVEYVKSNLVYILIAILMIFAIGLISYRGLEHVKLNKRLGHLGRLKTSIRNLIKETQKSYFKYKDIGKGEYNLRLGEYNKKIADINREARVITSKLKK